MAQHEREAPLVAVQQRVERAVDQPGEALLGVDDRRNRLHSIGVSVTETTPEIRMAVVIVTANSRNSRPSMPPMNRIGMNTAAATWSS